MGPRSLEIVDFGSSNRWHNNPAVIFSFETYDIVMYVKKHELKKTNILRRIEAEIRYIYILTRRGSNLRETDFSGHWRVDFWYLKMRPSADNFIQWALFLEIWAI